MEKEETTQEEKQTSSPRPPDYKSDPAGCSVWINKTKQGKEYLNIHLIGHKPINAFKT